MKEFKLRLNYCDGSTPPDYIKDIDIILKNYGIRLTIEDEWHDGYDICIIKVDEDYNPNNPTRDPWTCDDCGNSVYNYKCN